MQRLLDKKNKKTIFAVMKKLIIILLFLVSMSMHSQQVAVTATCYNAVPEQCNNDTIHTASMFVLNLNNPYSHRIIAVSRDLEERGFKMNYRVLVSGTVSGLYDGIWTIRDRMNKRWTNKIDFLVNLDMPVGKWNNITLKIIK